jgi:hypothetical protein
MSQKLEDSIIKALEVYHGAGKPKIASIARAFSFPYQTFRGRVQSRKNRAAQTPGNKALEPEQGIGLIL